MTETTRLPGVYFQAEAAQNRQTLPRMDIAAFVGLAASGPIDTPVAIEDPGRFHELFGDDAPLGGGVSAQLAPCVRAFFRNGGQRCWIVRVAGNTAARNNFTIPGLVHAGSGKPATARARSEGSWSDGLAVNTTLTHIPISAISASSAADGIRLKVQLGGGLRVVPGELIELTLPVLGMNAFLRIDEVDRNLFLHATEAYWFDDLGTPAPEPASWTASTWQAALLTFDLWTRAADRSTSILSGLGFAPEHPRYWGWLPDDIDLFPRIEEPVRRPPAPQLRLEASHPRFPVAGYGDQGLYLPIGMTGLLREQAFTGPATTALSVLEKDGNDKYDSSIFMDPLLRDAGTAALLDLAFQIQYQDYNPRALRGIHALVRVEEASILAVPDAVQATWLVEPPPRPLRLAAPHLAPVGGAYLSWTSVDNALAYTLQSSTSATFDTVQTVYNGPLTSAPNPVTAACPQYKYWRVRAEAGGVLSPWSNTEAAWQPKPEFEVCGVQFVGTPKLFPATPQPDGRIRLTWTTADGAVDTYRVEQAGDPGFQSVQILQETSQLFFEPLAPQVLAYFRVRGMRGGVAGPASNTVSYEPPPPLPPTVSATSESESTRSLNIHTAMLRLCAARGDMFAVLSLPQSFDEDATLEHRAELIAAVSDDDADRTLSFGGIYHPWTTVRETHGLSDARLLTTSPDGAVCGTYAARTLATGAWQAPANIQLRGVVAVDPPLDKSVFTFYASQINQVRQFPPGFMVFAAETLTGDRDFRSINVRRLFILLRRLALREGMVYTFQNNTPRFRRLIQQQWETVLGDLFVRGAFAGVTRDQSFRVVTDDTVNTPQSLDQGRFIVELRVCPSEPLHFLTVRLIQTGNEVLLAEELHHA